MTDLSIGDLIEIIESAYGFDSDDGELCDCSEWNELKRRISGPAQRPGACGVTDEMVHVACETYGEVYADDDKDMGDAMRAALKAALGILRPAYGSPDAALTARIETAIIANDVSYKDMILQQVLVSLAHSSPQSTTTRNLVDSLCDDCPPVGYETDKTRCLVCPRGGQELASTDRCICDKDHPLFKERGHHPHCPMSSTTRGTP